MPVLEAAASGGGPQVVPFVIPDSLEASDSDRTVRIVDYLGTHADYLVIMLLPENAVAFPNEYAYVE